MRPQKKIIQRKKVQVGEPIVGECTRNDDGFTVEDEKRQVIQNSRYQSHCHWGSKGVHKEKCYKIGTNCLLLVGTIPNKLAHQRRKTPEEGISVTYVLWGGKQRGVNTLEGRSWGEDTGKTSSKNEGPGGRHGWRAFAEDFRRSSHRTFASGRNARLELNKDRKWGLEKKGGEKHNMGSTPKKMGGFRNLEGPRRWGAVERWNANAIDRVKVLVKTCVS